MVKHRLVLGTLALAALVQVPAALAEDELPKQVFIEAKIVETTEDFARELGVRFGFDDAGGGPAASQGDPFAPDAPLFDPDASYTGAWLGGLPPTTTTLEIELAALEQEGRGEILSQPKIVTTDSEPAKIFVGETIRYAETRSGGGTTGPAPPGGLSLTFTPIVLDGDEIRLRIRVSEVPPATPSAPAIEGRRLATQVTLPDRGTVVLGGLFREEPPESESQLPFLGDLPYLGRLFRNQAPDPSRQELLIFITPRIQGETGGGSSSSGSGSGRSTSTDKPAGTRQQQIHRPRVDPNLNPPNVPQQPQPRPSYRRSY